MKEPTPKMLGSGSRYTRRNVLLGSTLGALVVAAKFSPFSMAEGVTADALNSVPSSVEATDLEIARLGEWLLEAEPESARLISAAAREVVGLTTADRIDWSVARRARTTLTEPQRIVEELANDNYVFVDGWLFTISEAGVALLFAAAQSGARD